MEYKIRFASKTTGNDILIYAIAKHVSFNVFESDPNKPFREFAADILDKVGYEAEQYYMIVNEYDKDKGGEGIDVKRYTILALSEVANILMPILNMAYYATELPYNELLDMPAWQVINTYYHEMRMRNHLPTA